MALTYIKASNGNSYYFDVTFRETHDLENIITQNPVQSGANINDHVYQQPILVTLDIGVSDCLGSYIAGQYSDNASRSVSAYLVLMGLWQQALILDVYTQLVSYRSMIIKSIVAVRDKTTQTILRATIVLQQLIITDAVSVTIAQGASTDPQVTDNSSGALAPKADIKTPTLRFPYDDYVEGSSTVSFSTDVKTLNGTTVKAGSAGRMYFKSYFGNFSMSKCVYFKDSNKFQVTPILTVSVQNASQFTILGRKAMTYEELAAKYGS
jgi:hypothetical protein